MKDEIDVQFCSTYVVHAIHDFTSTPGFNRTRNKFINWTLKHGLLPENPIYLLALICCVPYGAFHLSAWNAHFPTLVERSLWRGAGLSVVGLPMQMACFAGADYLLAWLRIRVMKSKNPDVDLTMLPLERPPDIRLDISGFISDFASEQTLLSRGGVCESEGSGTTDLRDRDVDSILATLLRPHE